MMALVLVATFHGFLERNVLKCQAKKHFFNMTNEANDLKKNLGQFEIIF